MNNPITYTLVTIGIGVIGFFLRDRFFRSEKKKANKRDQDKVYTWLMDEFRKKKQYEFRSTKAIASGTHLSEDRVREVAITDSRIHKSTGSNNDLWTVKNKPLL